MFRRDAILLLIFGLIGSRLAYAPGLDYYLTGGSQTYYWGLTAQWWLTDMVSIASFLWLTWLDHRSRSLYERHATKIIWVASLLLIAIPWFRHTLIHQQSVEGSLMHDGTLQTEVAVRALWQGKNPYQLDYQGTLYDYAFSTTAPIENSAFTHYVYPPALTYLAMPEVWLSDLSHTWPELNSLYLAALIVTVFLVTQRILPEQKRWVILLALANPLVTLYPLAGYNDVLVVSALALTALLATRKHWGWAGWWYALALGLKQVAWVTVPLWAIVQWRRYQQHPDERRQLRRGWWITLGVSAALYLPFLMWDARSLIDDLIIFPSGNLIGSYPIAGSTLWQLKTFWQGRTHVWDAIPSSLTAGIALIASLGFFGRRLWRSSSVVRWFGFSTLTILFTGLTHRFFHDNYLSVLVLMGILAYALALQPEQS